ncbi:hypothetical protein [Yinghuangia soli]|uniref:Uncharacterized protein n=1 Tax=Yinghuangia soli TaxID=2908204 RepID=A0AA41PXZ1_9ACTN|nr:hypothetical protein [Yinghuangia soli]MCF2527808.1 hypothetical protein [Yinghuangia soli]
MVRHQEAHIGRGALPRGPGARWASADSVVPGSAGHDGYDLRDFYLDVRLAADGSFRGSHTAYIIDGKAADDPADVDRFRYRRSHVLLGYAYGRLDVFGGSGDITIEGYGHSLVRVHPGPGTLTLHLDASVITYCPAMYTRAVLVRRT